MTGLKHTTLRHKMLAMIVDDRITRVRRDWVDRSTALSIGGSEARTLTELQRTAEAIIEVGGVWFPTDAASSQLAEWDAEYGKADPA